MQEIIITCVFFTTFLINSIDIGESRQILKILYVLNGKVAQTSQDAIGKKINFDITETDNIVNSFNHFISTISQNLACTIPIFDSINSVDTPFKIHTFLHFCMKLWRSKIVWKLKILQELTV